MSLSSRSVRSSRNNPCPVCEGIDGACRILQDDKDTTRSSTVFCHGLGDAKKGEIFNNYICVKVANGHTATFKPDNTAEWTLERRREWEEQKASRQQRAKDEERHRQERALPSEKRHELYSDILDQLNLDPATIADLERRRFTKDEIDSSEFRSVRKWQSLNRQYEVNLPGIGRDGNFLAVGDDGYLCPVRDFEGRIVGMQLRLHNPIDGNRYRWLSTPGEATLKLQPEDENPIAVFHPPGGKPEGIAIIEGTGTKPFFVSQRMNLLVIGASGAQWLSSQKLLEKYILAAIDKYGELPIKIIPDAGWALNWQIKQNLANTIDWLKSKFGQSIVSVLDWNQIHKSQGDIDELEDLSVVRSLKVESFLKKYKEVFGDKGFAPKRYQQWTEGRVKLTADIIQHEKWLSIPDGIQNECDILLVRKQLGGGKTQALIEFLKPLNMISLLVGYRNSLLNNTIARAIEMGLSALHIKDVLEKVEGGYVNFAADDSVKLWGGCADSFFKFNAIISRHPDYYLIHDEICSVLGHLKGGGTLKGRQQQAIEWDVNTIRNSQFCIMMDANLSDREVDFIRSLFPDKRIKVLDSVYDATPRTFYFVETETSLKDYTTLPKFLPSQLMELAKEANKVLWISDSQRSCEVADEILTKHGHKHFRLDGKTSHDELAKHLQSNPKQFILTEKLDSLSLSPSGESGLSIDLYGYFDAVCFDIRGTVGVNTLTQLSARLRDTNVPIYVACPEFVNMTVDPCPYAMKNVGEVLNQRIEHLLIQAMSADKELVDSQFVVDMFAEMGEKFASDPWFIESLKDSKQLKYEHQNLKLTLKTALAQAGNRVIDYVDKADEKQYNEVQDAKESVKKREAEKIFSAPDITYEKAQELAKQDVNYDVKCQIRKARLKHQLPGIEETPSWNADFIYTVLLDHTHFLDQRWRLKQFQDEELFNATFKFEKKYNFEFGFAPQDVWKSTNSKIEALKLLGIGRIIEAGIFSSQDDWVQAIVNEYYKIPEWFNLIGIPKVKQVFNDDGTLKNLQHIKGMVDRFLDYFGLESIQSKKVRGERSYSVTTHEKFEDYLLDIDECLATRAAMIIEEMREVSLMAIATKSEQTRQQQQEWDNQHSIELNKQMLESQLTHTCSDLGGTLPINIYKPTEKGAPYHHTETIPTTEVEEWKKPQCILDVAQMLNYCEDAEALALIRQCEIPADIFKLAARQLPHEKREQIRQWVISQNIDSA